LRVLLSFCSHFAVKLCVSRRSCCLFDVNLISSYVIEFCSIFSGNCCRVLSASFDTYLLAIWCQILQTLHHIWCLSADKSLIASIWRNLIYQTWLSGVIIWKVCWKTSFIDSSNRQNKEEHKTGSKYFLIHIDISILIDYPHRHRRRLCHVKLILLCIIHTWLKTEKVMIYKIFWPKNKIYSKLNL